MFEMYPAIPRVRLAHLPTPLEKLDRLSAELGGPQIWTKRDDQTGLATGGNKTRKLEYLVAAALAEGADTLITVGPRQSNHARQTAAAAAKYGLRAVLVLSGDDPGEWNGNLLLGDLVGAHVRWTGGRTRAEVLAEVIEEQERAGYKPYVIPVGGSNAVGATGCVMAMHELVRQLAEQELRIDHVIFASSSGGTQSGMIVGAKASGFEGRLLGIAIDKTEKGLPATVEELAPQIVERLGLNLSVTSEDIHINEEYLGAGYAVLGDQEREAIRLVARTEGILLDPVYTGRAMAGLADLVRRGVFARDENVLFWHTGGTAALFAYAEELCRDCG